MKPQDRLFAQSCRSPSAAAPCDFTRKPLCRGLEQEVALPRDSYLQHYFQDVYSVLRVGPPLMLVVRNLNISNAAPDVDRVCSIAGCNDTSLLNQVPAINPEGCTSI